MAYIYDLTDTWNAGGTTFNAIKMNVTDSASAAASKLVTLQTNGTEHFSVTKAGVGYFSGNVGIGTSSPGEKLQVVGSIRVNTTGTIFSNTYSAGNTQTWFVNNSSSSDVYLTNDTAQRYRMLTGVGHTWETAASGTAGASVSWVERMRITSAGNVGIGTSNPNTSLHTAGSLTVNDRVFLQRASSNLFLSIASYWNGSGSALNGTKGDILAIGNSGGDGLVFVNSDTERMRIDSSGNLLVGTTSATMGQTGIIMQPAISGSIGVLDIGHANGVASGNAYQRFYYNAGAIGSITQNGTTAVLYNTTSDARLKKNVADADDASVLIDSLQVRKFDWRADGSHQRYGFIAQELLEVAPEAVSQPANPEEMMGVDYSKLVPMLVKEIQSLRARVAQLEGN